MIVVDLIVIFFFFSGRRRHTRLQGDWSSDVCSSDLFYRISLNVHCEHSEAQFLLIASAILNLPAALAGCIVEAGCFKGGSTAKLSALARILGRKLVTFDSFEGIPENTEHHGKNIWGGS